MPGEASEAGSEPGPKLHSFSWGCSGNGDQKQGLVGWESETLQLEKNEKLGT